jgi:hypothetical protein
MTIDITEVNNEVVHQQPSYIVFGLDRFGIRVVCGCSER